MSWEPRPSKSPPTSGKKRGGYEGASLVCERCQHDARFVERREKTYTSLVGHIRLNRSYYHCRACGRGHMPWVKELGLTENSLTPAAAEITCIAGVQTSFAKAAEITLRKPSGLRLSESTVETHDRSNGRARRPAARRARAIRRADEVELVARCARTQVRLCQSRRHGRASTRPGRHARGRSHGLRRHDL